MRNKKKYMSIPDTDQVECVECGRIISKKHFGIRNLYEDGKRGKCAMCDWLRRHKSIPEIDGWDNQEVYTMIDFLLTNDSPYLNDLQPLIPNRSLKELC